MGVGAAVGECVGAIVGGIEVGASVGFSVSVAVDENSAVTVTSFGGKPTVIGLLVVFGTMGKPLYFHPMKLWPLLAVYINVAITLSYTKISFSCSSNSYLTLPSKPVRTSVPPPIGVAFVFIVYVLPKTLVLQAFFAYVFRCVLFCSKG